MPIVAEQFQFVIGVDTHVAPHAFAVVAAVNGAAVSQAEFPATEAGVSLAQAWGRRRAGGDAVAVLVEVEWIGSYGAAVARAFTAAGYRVVEADRQLAGDRRGVGKTDLLDAVRIARSVLGLEVD